MSGAKSLCGGRPRPPSGAAGRSSARSAEYANPALLGFTGPAHVNKYPKEPVAKQDSTRKLPQNSSSRKGRRPGAETTPMLYWAIFILAVGFTIFVILYFHDREKRHKAEMEADRLRLRFGGVIDAESELKKVESELTQARKSSAELQLRIQVQQANFQKLEEEENLITIAFYKPHYAFRNPRNTSTGWMTSRTGRSSSSRRTGPRHARPNGRWTAARPRAKNKPTSCLS